MINLRYHIVSITAVFLALGIGVTLGSSLIQRYTIDTLEGRLDELGERLDRTDGENRELRDEIQRRDEFDEQLGQDARVLFGGHLENVPVVVLAAQGTDDALLDDTRQSLRTAGAELSGVLVFTSRWDELSEGEVEELSTLLGRTFSNDRIARTTVLRRIATELVAATDDPPPPEPPPTGEAGSSDEDGSGIAGEPGDPPPDGVPTGETPTVPPDTVPPDTVADGEQDGGEQDGGEPGVALGDAEGEVDAPVPESEVIPALVEAGFLEFRPEGAATPVPSYGLRIVVVDDPESDLVPARALLPLLDAMTMLRSGTLPLVVAGPVVEAEVPDAGDDDETVLQPSPLVAAARVQERLASAVSTVDDATSFPGQAALVMALSDHGAPGHYGVTESAASLLPPRSE